MNLSLEMGEELPYSEKVFIESMKKIRESWPRVLINIALGVVIWLFGTAIFVPLGTGLVIRGIEISSVILGITLLAILVLLILIATDIRNLVDGVAGVVAYRVGGVREVTPEELEHYQLALRGIFYVIAASVIFLVFTPMLDWISPALRGIVLVLVFLWAVYTLYKAGLALRTEIARIAERSVKRLEKGLRKE